MRVTDRKTGNKVNFGGWNGKQGESMVRKSAFGVDHAHEVSKGAWGNAAAMTTGKALQSGQKMANKAAPKLKKARGAIQGAAMGVAGKAPTNSQKGMMGPAGKTGFQRGTAARTAGQQLTSGFKGGRGMQQAKSLSNNSAAAGNIRSQAGTAYSQGKQSLAGQAKPTQVGAFAGEHRNKLAAGAGAGALAMKPRKKDQ